MSGQPVQSLPPPSTWTAVLAERLLQCLHQLPHLNFKFRPMRDPFTMQLSSQYAQSLMLYGALSLAVALLLLLIIVVVWVCQCCRRSADTPHSRRHIRRLSTALFLLSVVCFMLLGCCLYGNEHVNKSVTTAITGLQDLSHQLRASLDAGQRLNATQTAASAHLEELTALIERKSESTPGLNQTMLREVDSLLTTVTDKVDEVKKLLAAFTDIQPSTRFLERSGRFGTRVEFERWALCLTMLLIMVTVLFAGVIAFCRQSRRGAITFSGLGIVIFLLAWLLYSMVLPLSIAYADFCKDGTDFLRTYVDQKALDTVEFYRNCRPIDGRHAATRIGQLPRNGQLPPGLPVEEIDDQYATVQESQQKLQFLLYTLFNRSEDIVAATAPLLTDVANSFKSIGALESYLSCQSLHNDVVVMYNGFCRDGFLGTVLVGVSLKLLGFFLFILLLVVSRSWHIFVRLPNDYTEVCDDDHYTPRGGHDQMPENVYDTNIFNPRARQLGGMIDRYADANDSSPDLHRRSAVGNHGGGVGGTLLRAPPTHSASLLPNGHNSNTNADKSPLLADGNGGNGGGVSGGGLPGRSHMSMSSERSLYLRGQQGPTAPYVSNTGTLGKRNSSNNSMSGGVYGNRQQYHLLNNLDFHQPEQQHYNA